MKRWKKIVLGSLGVLILAATVFVVPTVWGKPWSIDHYYYRVFLSFMFQHPQMLSSMRILEPVGFDSHNGELDDFSPEGTRRDEELFSDNLATLRRYDREKLDDKLSYDVLEYFLADAVDGQEFSHYGYPVNQMSGFQSNMPDFMITTHHLEDENDAKNYIQRLSKFGVAFDQMLETLELQESKGIVPPRFVMTRVLKEMRGFIEPTAIENDLYVQFLAKLEEFEGLETARRDELAAEVAQQIEQTVYPAYERLIDHYAALEPTASTDDGAWKLPNGDRYYAYMLRTNTTTDLSAEEIHTIGIAEVQRLHDGMREILVAEGYDATDIAVTMKKLNAEPRFLYPDTDEGREQILTDYQSIIDEISANMDEFFSVRPESPVEVRRVPEFKEATAPGAYYSSPAFDGSRPGVFYANLRSVKEIPKFGMRTLAYHEAVPGHHFQLALAQEMEGVPFFRRVLPFTAYSEGWGLYAEEVAAENGFQDDPYDRLGYLTGQLFRACRLVVDTGIHHKRWPRQQAIDYMLDCTGMPETDVIAEVERYIVIPGQACAYMIGKMEILRLREEAREALGDDFDIRKFHEVMLESGALPLTLLRAKVERWYQ